MGRTPLPEYAYFENAGAADIGGSGPNGNHPRGSRGYPKIGDGGRGGGEVLTIGDLSEST